jgi:hypothetical protein
MANGLKDIITQLEQQKTAIERALAALREVDGLSPDSATPAPPPAKAATKAKRKGGMTPEGRARLSEALRRRWAAKRAAKATASKKRGA